MVLCHDIIQILHLPDGDVRALCLVVALDDGFMRVAAVHGERLGESIPADRFLQEAPRRLFIPVLREQKVAGLALLIHGAREIIPLALDWNVRLVQAPAEPHRPLAAVKGFLQLRAVCDHPPGDGRVIHVDPTFKQEFCDVAPAQRGGDIPADAHQQNVGWEMSPFEAERHCLSPPLQHGLEGRPYHKSPQTKTCDKTHAGPGHALSSPSIGVGRRALPSRRIACRAGREVAHEGGRDRPVQPWRGTCFSPCSVHTASEGRRESTVAAPIVPDACMTRPGSTGVRHALETGQVVQVPYSPIQREDGLKKGRKPRCTRQRMICRHTRELRSLRSSTRDLPTALTSCTKLSRRIGMSKNRALSACTSCSTRWSMRPRTLWISWRSASSNSAAPQKGRSRW